MTVFYNAARERWQYDFRRNGERYQGYAEHPETRALARNKREAQEFEALLKARLRTDIPKARSPVIGGVTLAEVLADYAENHAQFNRQWRGQKTHIRELLEFFGPDRPVEEMTADDLDRYVAWARAQTVKKHVGGPIKSTGEFKDTGKPRGASTINGYLATLRAALRRAKKKDRVRATPEVPRLKVPNDLPNPIRPEDARKVLAHALPHLRDVITICSLTGMRLDECLLLRWEQVDLERGVIALDSHTKAGRGRAVYLNEPVLEVLRRIETERPEGQDRVILYRHKGNGKPRPVADIHRAWYSALDKAKLRGRYRFHDTRAAFCTALADAGADPLAIKELAGHASFTTTLRYIKAANGRLRDAVAKVPDFRLEPVRDFVRDYGAETGPKEPDSEKITE